MPSSIDPILELIWDVRCYQDSDSVPICIHCRYDAWHKPHSRVWPGLCLSMAETNWAVPCEPYSFSDPCWKELARTCPEAPCNMNMGMMGLKAVALLPGCFFLRSAAGIFQLLPMTLPLLVHIPLCSFISVLAVEGLALFVLSIIHGCC